MRCWYCLLLCCWPLAAQSDPVTIGGKNFTENYILAEASAQLLESRGYRVERRFGMNGTKIAYAALQNGAIDFYPEYTGTISEVILARPELIELRDIREALAARGQILLPPLGFDNSYSIAVTSKFAAEHGLRRISDLAGKDALRIGLPHEFLNRRDGWPGLRERYRLTQTPHGIEHSLAYGAITGAELDVIAVYSTDGEILRSDLTLLEDDLGYFPQYRAAFLGRADLAPGIVSILESLSARIDNHRMQQLNLAALDPDTSIAEVAGSLLLGAGLIDRARAAPAFLPQLWRNTQRHLKLTGIALLLAIVAGVGIAAAVHAHRTLANGFLYLTGLLQTIPSIALLALLIPFVGVGQKPAIIALFLYSLLPIARSTTTAMLAIPPAYRQVAAAMAMSRREELKFVLLPLAMPHVIAGIRTAAVISIGTATLAAFIGAGGLGDPIVTGLALNDSTLILQGALPAAGLAILTELMFGGIERALVPPHMRSGNAPP
ncbi:MAG: glycine betaine ABC transporter substrate-binding protein [Gammaproteobacteria bacterium]|nr:MAG: glycine betaine ABC transporter substrate-binding protein [Gammaproteobacteria bacterium]